MPLFRQIPRLTLSVMRHFMHALVCIEEDISYLIHTKTALTATVLWAWVILAAVIPPAEHTSAEGTMQASITGATVAQKIDPVPANTGALREVIDKARAEQIAMLNGEVTDSGSLRLEIAAESGAVVKEVKKIMNQRGVFFTPSSIANPELRARTMDKLKTVNGNVIVFDVKGSAVHFDAKNTPLAAELGLVDPKYNLQDVVRILHENNIEAIARYIAIKDYSLAAKVPSSQLNHPRTGHIISRGWIDPADPTALEYNRQIICELASSGVDEINLDYIRYDTQQSAAIGVFPPEERIGKIGEFIKMSREAIDACGPDTRLGVSTFAILGWDYDANVASIGQDVVRFAPMLDVISPMAYNANFSLENYGDPTGKRGRWNYLVYRTLTGYAEELGPEHAWKLRPWLQGWGVNTGELRHQIQGVFDSGTCGYMIWNAGNDYSHAYPAMDRVTPPERCL
jgi:hypothetical protein